uniref:Uncharacterized protein n=1 Tax=Pectinophora gossypiella TaxID=13191 RepID=A0A1E1WR04_PECGO
MSRKHKGCILSESDDSRKGDFSPDDDDDDYQLPQSGESSSEGDEEDLPHQTCRGSHLQARPVESENEDILSDENSKSDARPGSISPKDCGDSDSSEEIFPSRRRLSMLPQYRSKCISDDSSSNEESQGGEEEEETVEPGPRKATSSNDRSTRRVDESDECSSGSSNEIFIRRPSKSLPPPEATESPPASQERSQAASPDQDVIPQASPNIDVDVVSNLNSPAIDEEDPSGSRPITPLSQEEDDWIDVDSNDEESPPNCFKKYHSFMFST